MTSQSEPPIFDDPETFNHGLLYNFYKKRAKFTETYTTLRIISPIMKCAHLPFLYLKQFETKLLPLFFDRG